jgi:hypothetical protein
VYYLGVDDVLLSRHLRTALEYTHVHDDWVSPAREELGGMSAADALWRPIGVEKCVWEIVLHTAVWNENIVARVRTGEKSHPSEGSWPPLPDEPTDEAWTAARERLYASLAALDELLATSSVEQIEASAYGLEDLLCRFTHIGYHLGQIQKLNEFRLGQNPKLD